MGEINLVDVLNRLNISIINAEGAFKTTYEVLEELSQKWDRINIGGIAMKNNQALEYRMSKKMFDSLLAGRNEEEKKQNPYTYVAGIVNEQFGLKGTVTRISVYNA